MAGPSDRQANYLSSRSADVILSDIRPTKLTVDALRSINVLLDELLWMILSTARSFSTDQLKTALLRVLPTSLGKSALLEAEVELRAYWERTSAPTHSYTENLQDFPLQAAYELLRVKCEAYSTLNDSDENSELEARWQAKVVNAPGFSSSNTQYIASSALYLTAIIEFICEHVLSNTGRVAARDSSRTSATLNDFYVALCEDDTIYGLFKSMQVYTQIEQQSRALGKSPRRSKSIQRSLSEHSRAPRGTSSPSNGTSGNAENAQAAPRPRLSSESAGSAIGSTAVASTGSRSSLEKIRGKKLFGRSSAEKEGSVNGHAEGAGHKRAESLISNGKRSATPYEDRPGTPSEAEFDELMRSGGTMKVSLTPDRLRTFEVYNKEKTLRSGNRPTPPSTSPPRPANGKHPVDDVNGEQPVPNVLKDNNAMPRPLPPQPRQVESIVEDEENGVAGSLESERNAQRQRKKSKGGPPPVTYDTMLSGPTRTRSMSTSHSAPSTINGQQSIGRKASLNALGSMTSQSLANNDIFSRGPPSMAPISKSTNGASRYKSSSSFDDKLYESSDEDDLIPKRRVQKNKPPRVGGVSQATRDLISFLNDGPPDMGPPPVPMMPQADVKQQKQGRFRGLVSKLTRGTSSEKLVTQPSMDNFSSPAKSRTSGPAYVPPPLSAKKSLASISSYAQSQISVTIPPHERPPVPPLPISTAIHNHQQSLTEPVASSPARSRYSPTTPRKAVPVWPLDDKEITPVAVQPPVQPAFPARSQPSPQPAPQPAPHPAPQSVPQSLPQPAPQALPEKVPETLPTTVVETAPEPEKKKIEKIVIPKPTTEEVLSPPSPAAIPSTPSIRSIHSVHDVFPIVPKRTSSINAVSPTSPLPRDSAHSRSDRPAAFVPPASVSSSGKVLEQVKDMRKLMANATNAEECRLLVDMFLAQSGIPIKPTDFPPDKSLEPTEEQEASVVAALLSDEPDAIEDEEDSPVKVAEVDSKALDVVKDATTPETSPATPSAPALPTQYQHIKIPSTYHSPYRAHRVSADISSQYSQAVSAVSAGA